MASFPYWSKAVEDVAQSVNSSIDGLKESDAQAILQRVGRNSIQSQQRATPFRLFLNQFKSPIVLILLFATLISAFLKDWVDAVIILVIVLGSALLSFFQEYNANNAAEKLRAQVSLKANVLRDGKAVSIPTEEIVPGDVVLLSAGSLIPADGVVLEANDFFVNQAVLTGETFPVEKMPGVAAGQRRSGGAHQLVFMGTNVRSGSARVLIVETGLQHRLRADRRPPDPAPAGDRVRARHPPAWATCSPRSCSSWCIGIFAFNVFFHKPVLDSLLFSIALAVGLTPQLLPAIININLSKGSQAMAKHGVIVRRLESIENFGSMDVLCTDKTGTLTAGRGASWMARWTCTASHPSRCCAVCLL